MAFGSLEQDLSSSISRLAWNDVRWVLLGAKPAARFKVRRSDLPQIADCLVRSGLSVTAGFEPIGRASGPLAREWGSFDRSGFHAEIQSFVYVATDRRAAGALREADERCDHLLVARYLGYPACCAIVFAELSKTPGLSCTPAAFVYRHGLCSTWLMNIFMLECGATLISHLPCSHKCESTVRQARARLELLFEAEPEAARGLAQILSGTVLHARGGEVASFATTLNHGLENATGLIYQSHGGHINFERLVGSDIETLEEGTKIGQILLPRQDYQCYRFR